MAAQTALVMIVITGLIYGLILAAECQTPAVGGCGPTLSFPHIVPVETTLL